MPTSAEQLRTIKTFAHLVRYLEDELDWPLGQYGFEDLTFEYAPEEVGLREAEAAQVKAIHQLRPLPGGLPWGIFLIEFESRRLPVVVLRRILSHLVIKKRASANRADRAAFQANDLLLITAFGEETSDQREIAFAHFHQAAGDLPTLRVLGWDGADTPLKLASVAATLRDRLHWPSEPVDQEQWRAQWTGAFRHRLGHSIKTANELAEALATLARQIRDAALTLIAHEAEQGPLRTLHQAFRTALIHDLSEADFADTYAQTITSGLLTAAISRTEMSEGRHGTALLAENVADIVPVTNPFLKKMLQTFLTVGGRQGGIDFDELGIQDVVELLRSEDTDLPAVLRDFGNRTQGEDPVIHFYEHFLSAYNKKLKVQRGVFYTPQPVVSYIVRSVHELLQTEFGLEDGLASIVTWGEMQEKQPDLKIPNGMKPESPFVQILDPATGTATFLVEVIAVIHQTLTAKWAAQRLTDKQQLVAWNDYVPKHLLPRLHGYELMMAPYAIAHMKIGLKLHETGYRFQSEERVRVYLTNALEPASDVQGKLEGMAPALAHEAKAVNEIKQNQRFTVVIGNPPYSNFGQMNKILFILNLLDDYKRGLNERKINLDDDFIKFICYGQYILNQAGLGILGFITNNTYLDGITHRRMRESLREAFNRIWILDLHGSLMKADVCPDGTDDENVFDIKQGVSISLLCASPDNRAHLVFYHELWGNRAIKYSTLASLVFKTTKWLSLSEVAPNFFFVAKSLDAASEYEAWPSISEVFPESVTGIQTGRDSFVSSQLTADFEKKIADLKDASLSDADLSRRYDLPEFAGFDLHAIRQALRTDRTNTEFVKQWLYRPFDVRPILFHENGIKRMRGTIMKSLLKPNLALISVRQLAKTGFAHIFVTRYMGDGNTISLNTREYNYYFPLHIYQGENQQKLGIHSTLNLSSKIVSRICKLLNLKSAVSELGDMPQPLGVRDIFHYAYTVFHSPTYRTRYAEFLKIDFPRVPLTSSLDLFRALSELGGELVALHLMESPQLDQHLTTYTGSAAPVVDKVSWGNNTVWLDKAQKNGFIGVPENVWNFHIGGYQVCHKWLKDRKGRTLSADDLTHYHRIVVALSETIRLMAEIDDVIEQYGGWPGAFSEKSN